mmetsp:Transcript_154338/g.272508  ORF Transcript_154338/g.272508 Transcript_154338/m.272508 type:complete len:215 (+) Transcript_154338:467-1111(+)
MSGRQCQRSAHSPWRQSWPAPHHKMLFRLLLLLLLPEAWRSNLRSSLLLLQKGPHHFDCRSGTLWQSGRQAAQVLPSDAAWPTSLPNLQFPRWQALRGCEPWNFLGGKNTSGPLRQQSFRGAPSSPRRWQPTRRYGLPSRSRDLLQPLRTLSQCLLLWPCPLQGSSRSEQDLPLQSPSFLRALPFPSCSLPKACYLARGNPSSPAPTLQNCARH